VGLADAGADPRAALGAVSVLGPVQVLVVAFLAPVKAVGRGEHLVGVLVADAGGERLAPGLQQLTVLVEDGDAGVGRARANVHPVLGIDDHAAAVAVLHAARQLAPLLVQGVGEFAGPILHRGLLRVGGEGAAVRQPGRAGGAGPVEEVAAGPAGAGEESGPNRAPFD